MPDAQPVILALDRYDRHLPFFDGTVHAPSGIALDVIQAGEAGTLRDGAHRHRRMLTEGEFDAAEVSLSSYVMAHARGLPFTAIPVFPRRLFSQTQIYVNEAAGITRPRDLAGRRIGLQSFQTTLAVLAKGDVAHEYGVDLKSVSWVVRADETIPFEPGPGWSLEYVPADADLGGMLAEGAIEALFLSRVPNSLGQRGVRRLFDDPRAECASFFRRNGYFPIMHVLVMSHDAVARVPGLPRILLDLFRDAKALADGFRDDPGWSQLAFGRLALEDQQAALGDDPWPLGFAANRACLERFVGYSQDQGLIDRKPDPAELFHPSVIES